jgi:hypothetical protein
VLLDQMIACCVRRRCDGSIIIAVTSFLADVPLLDSDPSVIAVPTIVTVERAVVSVDEGHVTGAAITTVHAVVQTRDALSVTLIADPDVPLLDTLSNIVWISFADVHNLCCGFDGVQKIERRLCPFKGHLAIHTNFNFHRTPHAAVSGS